MNGIADKELGVHKKGAVFLDRDGTLIEDRGDIRDSSQIVFYPNTTDALRGATLGEWL